MSRRFEQFAMLLEGVLGYRPGEDSLRPLMTGLREYDEMVRARGLSPDYVAPSSTETQAIFVLIQQLYKVAAANKPADRRMDFLEQVAIARRDYLERTRKAEAARRTAGRVATGVAGLSVMTALAGAAGAEPDLSNLEEMPAPIRELIEFITGEVATDPTNTPAGPALGSAIEESPQPSTGEQPGKTSLPRSRPPRAAAAEENTQHSNPEPGAPAAGSSEGFNRSAIIKTQPPAATTAASAPPASDGLPAQAPSDQDDGLIGETETEADPPGQTEPETDPDDTEPASDTEGDPAGYGTGFGVQPPGKTGSASGQGDGPPGKTDTAPGLTTDQPGKTGDAPGQNTNAPGVTGAAPGLQE